MLIKKNKDIKILVIDDNYYNVQLLEEFLIFEEYQILYTNSGPSAIELLKQRTVDLILLDIIMPKVDGFQTCEILKSNPQTAHIPIIFLSALNETTDKVKAFKYGAADYLTKPLELEEVNARIKSHLKLSFLEQMLTETNKNLEQTVYKRTQELENANELLAKEVSDKKKYIEKLIIKSTELERKQQELHLSEARIKEAQKIAGMGIWEWEQGKDLFCSKEIYTALGIDTSYQLKQIDDIYPFLHPEDRKKSIDIFSSAIETVQIDPQALTYHEIKKTHELRIIQKNGSIRYLLGRAHPVFNSNNVFVCIQGILWDITEQKLTQLNLFESQERFKKIFENSKIGIVLETSDGTIFSANPACCNILECSEEELINVNFKTITHPEDYDIEKVHFEALISGKSNSYSLDKRCICKNKKIKWVNVSISCLRNASHKILYLIGSIIDITERKETEREILTAVVKAEENEKRAFAQNLHDDLGPLLSSIRLLTDQLGSVNEVEKQQELTKNIKQMLADAVQMTRNISNKLMPNILQDFGFFKAIISFAEKVNITETISININFDDININHRLEEVVENVLYRIVTELINNTLKHADADFIFIEGKIKDDEIVVEYRDNGKGFIFKDSISKNIGLGLSNIANRLKTINGKYDFFSEPGDGMQFIAKIKI